MTQTTEAEPQQDEQEILQPAEVAALDETTSVVTQTPAGSLTLRPNQVNLDPNQVAALKAIGIDTEEDPHVIPHVRPFVHMCQVRGLDPWMREAYLIGRGKGNRRTYTMQTGIDGYRKMAQRTGRFIRIKATYWTGRDDDDRSYREMEVDGDVIMRRVWFDQWPASRGNPGAAKVIVEHYDESNNVTTTSAVADWEMYAAYRDVWEDKPGGGRRPKVENGKPVRELNEMWTNGGPFMLSKVCLALALRNAFPGAMSGVYVAEEMARNDAREADRIVAEQAAARREAFARSRTPEVAAPSESPAEPEEESAEPTPVAETVAEVVETLSAPTAEQWLAELTWQADVLGRTPEALATRRVRALRKNLETFTAEEVAPLVTGLRGAVVSALDGDHAEHYRLLADSKVPLDDVRVADSEVHDPDPIEQDPEDPEDVHPFRGDAECDVCGLPEGVGPHPNEEQA